MAHTTFRKTVPYNNIKLGGDVAQWSIYEITSADNSSYKGAIGMADISMADMQRAAGSNVDPNDGRVSIGLLSPMRYAVAELGDVSAGDGVYSYQVDGTNSNFVAGRIWNLASNPDTIRLGRMAGWDYTAAVDPTDIDEMDFYNGGSIIWVQTAAYGLELFKDQQMWVFGVKQNGQNGTRRPLILRSNKTGDKFSTYPQTNFTVGSHASDMNDIGMAVPFRAEYGSTFGTNIASYATFGRRTSSTGQVKAQAYTVNINSNGSISTATTGTQGSFSTGLSSNYVVAGGTYVRDNLMVIVGGQGGNGQSINRISWGGSSFSSSTSMLTSTGGNGAVRSDVVSTDAFGAANNRTAAVFVDTQSTWNRYCKIRMYNMNSSISTLGSVTTVFDVSNSLKAPHCTLLATDSNYMFVLVGVSDTSGDIRLKVMRWNYGGNTWTSLDDATYQYNDTSVQQWFSLTTLTAVEKTAITKNGEAFVPGGANDFEQRVYFALGVSTNSETDDVEIQYGYYDITNDVIIFTDSGLIWNGRNAQLAKNPYGTDGRTNLENLPIRSEAGPTYMPIIGGRRVSSTVKNLSVGMIGLDYKPDWGNAATGDPGSDIISTTGLLYTQNTNVEDPSSTADWDEAGVWKVIGPHPHPSHVAPTTEGWSMQGSNRDAYGFDLAGVGANLDFFTANFVDTDNNTWGDWFKNELIPYQLNQPIYVKLSTGNGGLNATYTIPAGGKRVANVNDEYLYVDWRGGSNSHAQNSWAFLLAAEGAEETKIAITFSQSPF